MTNNSSITVRDIAKEANVSVATVSRVLNNSDRVTSKTKNKVQKVIDKYDFKPNALARSLYNKRTNIIGCILPDITSHYFAKMFLEIERNAHKYGYTMFLCNSMNDSELESVYMDKLMEQQVDGVILMGGRMNDSQPTEKEINEVKAITAVCPTIIINGDIDDEKVHIINTDEVFAVDRMVKYLVGNGHSRVAMVGGAKSITVTETKMKAFVDACKKYGLDDDEYFTQYGEYYSKGGYDIMKKLYEEDRVPEAIIGINDEVTVGVLHACMELNIRVPDDLSLLGYDNIDLGENTYPMLSSYSHPYEEIGKIAIETINRCLKNEKAVNKQLIRGEIIERESIKKK